MSKRKGLSYEEKRTKMLEIFHETKDFFQMKELEKMGPKMKGVVSQSVKEIVDSLIADNLVIMEKIGTSNYYWSFPSTTLVTRQKQISKFESELQDLIDQENTIENKIEEARSAREISDEREKLLATFKELEDAKEKLVIELQKHADNDPKVLGAKETASETARKGANLWTDNILALQAYCRDKFNISASDFNTQFELPEELEEI